MNIQYAIQNGKVFVLEVNPRASRTVPFVGKATGVPLPKIAVGLMLGKKLDEFKHLTGGIVNGVLPVPSFFVKTSVFPFNKFPGVDPALGPEMRSTGEVMGTAAGIKAAGVPVKTVKRGGFAEGGQAEFGDLHDYRQQQYFSG